MANFSIKDLSEFSGLKQHTIRVWEQRYSFLQPSRTASTHRSYTPEDLGILMDAALLNQNGYKVSLIDKMSFEKKLQIFSSVVDQQQKAVHELIIHMAMMDPLSFEKKLDQAVQSWGIDETIQNILLPFCEKAGLLQGTYNKNYIENIILIRQAVKNKLVFGIEKAASGISRKKIVLLFLTGSQVQELPMLYLQYMLKMNGFTTLNIGQQVTVEHLEVIGKKYKPDYLITHLGKGGTANRSLEAYLETLEGKTEFLSIEHALGNEEHSYKCAPTPIKLLQILLEKEALHLLS